MKNLFKIITINILIFLSLLLISDFILFSITKKKETLYEYESYFHYIIKDPTIVSNYFKMKDFSNIDEYSRRYSGIEYKDKEPIILFGCSYAYGDHLLYYQTFGYKLSHLLKRPVYNRAIPAGGLTVMYAQTLSQDFYNEVPPSENVIFVMIFDNYRRMFGDVFSICNDFFYIHYKLKNGNFIMDNYNNWLLNFLKSSYTIRYLYKSYVLSYINNPKNAEKITDLALLYFIKSRENLEKRWNKKINFNVILYENMLLEDILKFKLEKNGFNVILTDELTTADLNKEEYKMQDNRHPTEAAWDLLTPLIADKIQLTD